MSKDIVHYFKLSEPNLQTYKAVCGFELKKIPIPNTPLNTFNGGFTYQKHLTTCVECLKVLFETPKKKKPTKSE